MLDSLKIQFALTIPFGRPNNNGSVFSKEAIEKAVCDFNGKLPILYQDNDSCKDSIVVGNTVGETCSVLWDDEHQVCEVVVDGNLYFAGADIVVNEMNGNTITDFNIVSVGVSK